MKEINFEKMQKEVSQKKNWLNGKKQRNSLAKNSNMGKKKRKKGKEQ